MVATRPVGYEVYKVCGAPGTGKVFKGLKRSRVNHLLKNRLKKTGITNSIARYMVMPLTLKDLSARYSVLG